MPIWAYIVLIVAGAWALLAYISLDEKKHGYVFGFALQLVAFVGVCTALALVGQLWRSY